MSEEKYSMGNIGISVALIDPNKLPEEDREEYKKAIENVLAGINEMMRIGKKNEEVTKKAYEEQFPDKKEKSPNGESGK